MGTLTTNYSFMKPTPGGDTGTWGADFTGGDDPAVDDSPGLNGNWSKLDSVFKALEDRVEATESAVSGALIPVNGLFLSTSSTNPATSLGYGTWTAYGAGRALVGVGSNGTSTWTGGETRGAETHTLSTSQIPSHTHSVDPPSTTTSSSGSHSHVVRDTKTSNTSVATDGGPWKDVVEGDTSDSRTTNTTGSHTHTLNISSFTSGSAGSGGSHNNIQPSIAVYVWRRTA